MRWTNPPRGKSRARNPNPRGGTARAKSPKASCNAGCQFRPQSFYVEGYLHITIRGHTHAVSKTEEKHPNQVTQTKIIDPCTGREVGFRQTTPAGTPAKDPQLKSQIPLPTNLPAFQKFGIQVGGHQQKNLLKWATPTRKSSQVQPAINKTKSF